MKKLVLLVCLMALSAAQALTLQDALNKIGECIADSKVMKSTMTALPAADQATFLAKVNEAISEMPGSEEMKAATYLNVNRAAVLGAAKAKNALAVVAEVYATVPVAALPMIVESFSSDLFNRQADPTVTYGDDQYAKICEAVMEKVNERLASADDSDKRAQIAAATMLKGAGETSPELKAAVVNTLPEEVRENAAQSITEIAAGNFDGIAEPEYQMELAIRLSGTQLQEMVLADVDEGLFHMGGSYNSHDHSHVYEAESVIPPTMEPDGYQGQTTGN